jgi:hypothetical protein
VIDVSDRTSPSVVAESAFVSEPLDLHIHAQHAAVVLRSGVRLFDITFPDDLKLSSSIAVADARAVHLSAGDLHLVRASRFEIYELRDPTNPRRLDRTVPSGVAPTSIDMQAGMAFLGDGSHGLRIVDVQYAPDPYVRGDYFAGAGANDTAVAGPFAYTCALDAGLLISHVDKAPGQDVELVARVGTTSRAQAVAATEASVFVGTIGDGLQTYRADGTSPPERLASTNPPARVNQVALEGQLSYVAADAEGVVVVDVSDPARPKTLSTVGADRRVVGVAASGDVAVLARLEDIAVVDAADLRSPQVLAALDTPGTAEGVDLVGEHAFVADALEGLTVVDVGDSESPSVVANVDTPGMAWRVRVVDDRAYVADGWDGGVRVFDVVDPKAPREVEHVFVPGLVRDVEVADGTMYVSSLNGGLYLFERGRQNQATATSPPELSPSPTVPVSPGTTVTPTAPVTATPTTPSPSAAWTLYVPILHVDYTPVDAPARAAAASGDFIYFGSGPRLFAMMETHFVGYKARGVSDRIRVDVIDISDPSGPERVGELSLRDDSLWVYTLVASRGHLLASGAQLDHWDADPPVSNAEAFFVIAPAAPGHVGQAAAQVVGKLLLEEPYVPRRLGEPLAVSGDRAFVSRGKAGGLFAIDVSQLDRPQLIEARRPSQ